MAKLDSPHQRVSAVNNLVKKYGRRTAVRGVSFTIQRGEVVAILGPNGAGKTSTVEILEGYRNRTAGSIEILGEDPWHASRSWRARVGMVLQSTSLDPQLRVGELVTMYARLYPHARDAGEVLDMVNLTKERGSQVGHLSGGQQRRVDLALGIIGNPDILFLDEPTTGFDPVARHACWDVIKRLRAEGLTTVLTTHYLEEAQVLADRIILIVAGKVVADAKPADIGGQQRLATRIAFTLDRAAGNLLPEPWKSAAHINDERIELETNDVTSELSALLSWSRKHKAALHNLTVSQPSLEDVYLKLVGQAEHQQ